MILSVVSFVFVVINRAMAVCISLMFGRLGSVVGSNTAALLLDNHCEVAFYLSGSTVIGNLLHHSLFQKFPTRKLEIDHFLCFFSFD